MIFKRGAASMISAVTWVPERIIKASYSPTMDFSSSAGRPVRTSTWATWDKMSIPFWSMGSDTKTFVIVRRHAVVQCSDHC